MKKSFNVFYTRLIYTLKNIHKGKFEIIPIGIYSSLTNQIKFIALILGMYISAIYHIYTNGLFDVAYVVTQCTSFGIVFIALGGDELLTKYAENWEERYLVPVRYLEFSLIYALTSAVIKLITMGGMFLMVNMPNNFISRYLTIPICQYVPEFMFRSCWAFTIIQFCLAISYMLFNLAIILRNTD